METTKAVEKAPTFASQGADHKPEQKTKRKRVDGRSRAISLPVIPTTLTYSTPSVAMNRTLPLLCMAWSLFPQDSLLHRSISVDTTRRPG